MKKSVKNNIDDMQSLVKRMPKTINEVLSFEGDDEMGMSYDEEMMDEPSEPTEEPKAEVSEPDIEGFIANMRKESLSIMKHLADDPDNAIYQFAKKIFQLADKAHEDQKEGKDINGQPKQQPQQNMQM